MITEAYVSFETAKLLKEKGFDGQCLSKYNSNGCIWDNIRYDGMLLGNNDIFPQEYLAPTLQMTMKWLQKTHRILVVPDYVYECTDTSWVYKIYRLGDNGKPERCVVKGVSYDDDNNPTERIVGYRDYELSYEDYATREEACEAGIRYCLENLI